MCMGYSIAIIAWNTSSIQISVTAIVVVSVGVLLAMRGPVVNIVLIYLVPSFMFIIYLYISKYDMHKISDFANGFSVIGASIVVYGYEEKLRKSKFYADKYLIEAHQELNLASKELYDKNVELQYSLENVKQLSGLLPICATCKKIRDDKNYWQQVEAYISAYTDARFSHSICPECYERVVKPDLARMQEMTANEPPA